MPPSTARAADAVVFDVGNVLVVWESRLLYRKLSDDEEAIEAFLAQVCTSEWNHRGDLGERWKDLVAELAAAHPEHADWIRAYHQRWHEMLGEAVEGSVAALRALLAARRFGVTPARTLFVDDRADNVAAAAAAGWLTHHFSDPAGLHGALARLGLPTPSGTSGGGGRGGT